MNETLFRRVQIAGLFIISFLGTIVHMLMHLFGPEHEVMSGGQMWMTLAYFLLYLLPPFLLLITQVKIWRWIAAVVGALMTAMCLFDSAMHAFEPGGIALGLSSFVIGGGAGVVAVILAFKWAAAKEAS